MHATSASREKDRHDADDCCLRTDLSDRSIAPADQVRVMSHPAVAANISAGPQAAYRARDQ
jgi:hypothetical protein